MECFYVVAFNAFSAALSHLPCFLELPHSFIFCILSKIDNAKKRDYLNDESILIVDFQRNAARVFFKNYREPFVLLCEIRGF